MGCSRPRGLRTDLEGAEEPGREAAEWEARSISGQPGGRVASPAGARRRPGATGNRVPGSRSRPRRPGPLPSTLVRVRTGLLQALSGATRAECFFMMSLPPAGAPPPIAYMLGPAGARLAGPGASTGEERERLGAPALRSRAAVSARGSLRRPPRGAHRLRPRSPSAPARTASRSEVAANSNVTYKCAPRSHPAGSPAPPPAPGRPAPQPGFLPRSPAPGAASGPGSGPARSSPAAPALSWDQRRGGRPCKLSLGASQV